MLVIWNRWGILVLLIIIAALFGTQALVDWHLGKGFYTANYWPKAAAFLSAAAVIAVVGYMLNRKEPTWATKHRFFFFPMEYWAAVIVIITALISYGEYTRG